MKWQQLFLNFYKMSIYGWTKCYKERIVHSFGNTMFSVTVKEMAERTNMKDQCCSGVHERVMGHPVTSTAAERGQQNNLIGDFYQSVGHSCQSVGQNRYCVRSLTLTIVGRSTTGSGGGGSSTDDEYRMRLGHCTCIDGGGGSSGSGGVVGHCLRVNGHHEQTLPKCYQQTDSGFHTDSEDECKDDVKMFLENERDNALLREEWAIALLSALLNKKL